MRTPNRLTHNVLLLFASVVTCLSSLLGRAADAPTILNVDARGISDRVLHATLHIPSAPGPLTLVYPKWIPGEHGPTGPITDLVGLKMSAAGKAIAWRRDSQDFYAFNLDLPSGATAVDVSLDFLLASDMQGYSSAASSSANLGDISWNTVVLYPKGVAASSITFVPHLRLPDGWKFATALTRSAESEGDIEFAPVTLERLIDSPVVAGKYIRTFDLLRGDAPVRLDVIADSAAALDMTTNDQASFARLAAEANALFGAHHYRHYDFLLTLSDVVAHFGLEHHECSDDRGPERMLIDDRIRKAEAPLLPHEMVHSWNGKYRRPAGLATPDYQQPMKTELLWVYEGLTDYLGQVLAVRSGLWNRTNYTQELALEAAMLEHRRGRDWRPLVDTADAAHLLYSAGHGGPASWRRSVDFYPEGDLIWLEADVMIRQLTKGKRSLDDFCQRFYGAPNTPPRVVPYTVDDVVAALNAVAPFDWHRFFEQRVYAINPHAPMGGIEAGGWRLVYRDKESDMLKTGESSQKSTDLTCSIGLMLTKDGGIVDVIPGSPGDRGGVAPGMKLVAVNNRRWTTDLLRTAIKEAKGGTAPIELLVENGDVFKTCTVDYHDGERYPDLERDPAKPDLLSQIIKPRTKAASLVK